MLEDSEKEHAGVAHNFPLRSEVSDINVTFLMFTCVTDNLVFSYASLLVSYCLQRMLFDSYSETNKENKKV